MAFPILLVIFSATVYHEVMILFSLTCWMETVIFQFCAIYERNLCKSV